MINQDSPIKNTTEDRLNRKGFAEEIARILLQNELPESLAIGLYGRWGSGKTSLLNMIFETLAEDDTETKPVIVRFNPWICSDPLQLISQFFKQLATELTLKEHKKIYDLVSEYGNLLEVSRLIPYVGSFLAEGGKVFKQKADKKKEEANNDLQGKKKKIIDQFRKDGIKLVVFIDDIDRLTKEEIVAVFQLVKSLGDFPNTVYLLAFDYNVVVKALSEVQYGDGKEYLEKIIQVPIEIPMPNVSDVQDCLLAKLNDIMADFPLNKWNTDRWQSLFQMGLRVFFHDIRDVNRFVNMFNFKYSSMKFETDIMDLFALTAIEVFEPGLYRSIQKHGDIICGVHVPSFSHEDYEKKKIEAILQEMMDSCDKENAENSKWILGFLFPKIRSYSNTGIYMGDIYDQHRLLARSRIADKRCFGRYFSLSLENDAIPSSEIQRFMYEADETYMLGVIDSKYFEQRGGRLFEEIAAYAKENNPPLTEERIQLIITCLLRKYESYNDRVAESFFSIPIVWHIKYCVKTLLFNVSEQAREGLLQTVYEDPRVSINAVSSSLWELERQHGRYSGDDEMGAKWLFPEDSLVKLEEVFKERAIAILSSSDTWKSIQSLEFLRFLYVLDPDTTKTRVQGFTQDDHFLLKLISSYSVTGMVRTSRLGYFSSYESYSVYMDDLSKLIDPSEAYRRIVKICSSSDFCDISEKDQLRLAAFLLSIEKPDDERVNKGAFSEEEVKKRRYFALENAGRAIEQ